MLVVISSNNSLEPSLILMLKVVIIYHDRIQRVRNECMYITMFL